MVDGNKCDKLYKTEGMEDTGQEMPLRKITMGDKNTMNMIEDSRRLNRTEQVIPINMTDNKNGKVSIRTVR